MDRNILLITNMPTPYRIPLFNQINSELKSVGFNLVVVFGVDGESRRQWNIDYTEFEFEYKVLSGDGVKRSGAETISLYYTGLLRMILKTKPACIITPGFSIATLKVFFITLILRAKYIVWTGEINLSGKRKSFNRKFIKRILSFRATKFITYGVLAKKYLMSLGVKEEKINIAINTVDTNYFYTAATKLEYSQNKQFIYVGNLTQGKRVDLILNALAQLKSHNEEISLLIIGDGPVRSKLENMCEYLSLSNHVRFAGFLQKDELPNHFNNSICMLFPSEYDIWGLVLCEAMASGVPCISSVKSGATHDLIDDGVNGFSLDFEDTDELVKKMQWMLDNQDATRKMGLDAQDFMLSRASINTSALAFSNTISSVLS